VTSAHGAGVVTHDMGVIAALADDVQVMRDGSVVERGRCADPRATAHDYTRRCWPRRRASRTPAPEPCPRRARAPLDVADSRCTRSRGLARPRELTPSTMRVVRVARGEALGIVGNPAAANRR
jgi:ABC-type glutathione transport system ATPase component